MSDSFTKVSNLLSKRELLLNSSLPLIKNQAILIADCFHAEVQEIEEVKGRYIRLKTDLYFQYSPVCYLGEWLEERFLIRKNQAGHLALFYEKNHAEELSDGIQDLNYKSMPFRNGLLTSIELTFVSNKKITLETKVRAP